MSAWLTRRTTFIFTIAAFALMTVAPPASAESAVDTFKAMGVYLSAAVRLFSVTQAHADKIDPKGLKKEDLDAVRVDLRELRSELDRLISAKGIFVGDLRSYIQMSEKDSFDSPAHRKRTWMRAQDSIAQITTVTHDVLKIVTRPDSKLGIVVPEKDLVTLKKAMNQRITLLGRFQEMPPPTTKGEISELDIIADRHDELRQVTEQLRVSLAEILREFPG